MTAEEIRENCAGYYPLDDPKAIAEQLSTLAALVQELTAQVAELNAKTPSLRMQTATAVLQGLCANHENAGSFELFASNALKQADTLIVLEKGEL
jgi:prefoldin subunit 5